MFSNRTLFRGIVLGACIALAAIGPSAHANDYAVLHSFSGSDGTWPMGDPRLDDGGNVYGTTVIGGGSACGGDGCGTVYKLAPDGTLTTLYAFTGGHDGSAPYGGLTVNRSTGDLYGTALGAGANGWGVIYKIAANGTETVLHNFAQSEGSNPIGRMIRDAFGNFYGVCQYDGGGGYGSVFKLTTDGTFTVLHTFTGKDGGFPNSTLRRDSAGDLYGVTNVGGDYAQGVVYKIAADGTFTVLHSFAGSDGQYPAGGLARDKSGNLYGTAEYGGGGPNLGVVFKLAPDGTYTELHAFSGGQDGSGPYGDLLINNGQLYGTTWLGGGTGCGGLGCGTVFKIGRSGDERILHRFTGAPNDGANSYVGLANGKNGVLYGVTQIGGADNMGTVFSVTKR